MASFLPKRKSPPIDKETKSDILFRFLWSMPSYQKREGGISNDQIRKSEPQKRNDSKGS